MKHLPDSLVATLVRKLPILLEAVASETCDIRVKEAARLLRKALKRLKHETD